MLRRCLNGINLIVVFFPRVLWSQRSSQDKFVAVFCHFFFFFCSSRDSPDAVLHNKAEGYFRSSPYISSRIARGRPKRILLVVRKLIRGGQRHNISLLCRPFSLKVSYNTIISYCIHYYFWPEFRPISL